MSPIIIQAIGFVGVLFFIISYQIKSNKMLFLLQLLSGITAVIVAMVFTRGKRHLKQND